MNLARIWLILSGLAITIIGCGPGPGIKKEAEPTLLPSISINAGQEYTKVVSATLTLSARRATEMYVTNDSTCAAGGTWEPLAASKSWNLVSLNALNTVYIKVRNVTEESACIGDTITHDNTPPTFMLVQPLMGDVVNNANKTAFLFQGTCDESGSTITIGGAVSTTTTCAFGAFSKSLDLSLAAEGTVTLTAQMNDLATNSSPVFSVDVVKDSVNPTLSFASPADGTWVNIANNTLFTLSGACSEEGRNVVITGSASSTVSCTGLNWTVNLNLSAEADGANAISFTVNHGDASGNTATPITRTFSKDTVAPDAPVITTPAANPFTSSATTLTVSGTCEGGNSIQVTGAETLADTCLAGAFSTDLSQPLNAVYNYMFRQTDSAGNQSTSFAFDWEVDSSIPAMPVLTSPNPNPIINNLNTITIAGSCVTGNIVDLSGDLTASDVTNPAGLLSLTCAANSFSFTLQKLADGIYSFAVVQTNALDITSPAVTVRWTRDTVVPAVIVISNPPSDPYTAGGNLTVKGSCETGARVFVTGDSVQNTLCTAGAFSFLINKAVDATYNFSFIQTDPAGNSSSAETQAWVRDSSVLPAPVIASPAASPFRSNTTTLTVSGTCVEGYTVTLSAGAIASEILAPASSLTQVCTGEVFSFTISKATDGTYSFSFTQTDSVTTSPAAAVSWIRDTTPPDTTLTLTPLNPNLKLSATFNFTSTETGATFECRLDGGIWASCVSPLLYSTIANGNHVVEVKAKDLAENTDVTPASFSWNQDAYNTVALYHFDSGAEFVDQSFYTGLQNNVLTNFGSTVASPGKFLVGRTLSSTLLNHLEAPDNNSLDVVTEKMTVDFWVKFNSYPGTNNSTALLVSKSGLSGQMGWEIGMKRMSGSWRPTFKGSLNGTTLLEKRTTAPCFTDTTTWHHLAVTWNKGTVKFFCDGVAMGTGVIGTAGTSVLFNSTSPMRIGRTETMLSPNVYFDGQIDELRISQIIRWNLGFTVPTIQHEP